MAIVCVLEHVLRAEGFVVEEPQHLCQWYWRYVDCQLGHDRPPGHPREAVSGLRAGAGRGEGAAGASVGLLGSVLGGHALLAGRWRCLGCDGSNTERAGLLDQVLREWRDI